MKKYKRKNVDKKIEWIRENGKSYRYRDKHRERERENRFLQQFADSLPCLTVFKLVHLLSLYEGMFPE